MNKKIKLSLITIATIVSANTNAQTFYSCIPEECPSGQYFNGKRCLPVENLISSSQQCPPGYIYSFSRCCRNTAPYSEFFNMNSNLPAPVSHKGQKSYKNGDNYFDINLTPDDYVDYVDYSTGKKKRLYGRCHILGLSGLTTTTYSKTTVDLE